MAILPGPRATDNSITGRREPAAWAASAEALADWTWENLRVLYRAHGRYLPLDKRDRQTCFTAHWPLDLGGLREHYVGADVGHVRGTHLCDPRGRCGGLVIDADVHGCDPAAALRNEAAALNYWRRLLDLGFHPLLYDSNGGGGFHIRTIFGRRIGMAVAYEFGRWLVSDYDQLGISRPETFPKSNVVGRGYGGWIRLPGRHHTRNHWTRVWDGERWVEGERAIRLILNTKPAFGCIPDAALNYRPPKHREPAQEPRESPLIDAAVVDAATADLPPDVRQAIHGMLARAVGERNGRIFDLRRWVLGTSLGELPVEQHKPLLTLWHRLCRPFIGTKDFGASWEDYKRAARYARVPRGGGVPRHLRWLERAYDAAMRLPVDALPKLPRLREPTRRLAAMCQFLAAYRGGAFGLPQVALADVLGVSQPAISKQVRRLIESGFLILMRRPVFQTDRQAGLYAEYRLSH